MENETKMDENSAQTVTRMQALSSRTYRIYLALITLPPPKVSVQVQALCAIELTGGSMRERERERQIESLNGTPP
jgi:hypothetical protein